MSTSGHGWGQHGGAARLDIRGAIARVRAGAGARARIVLAVGLDQICPIYVSSHLDQWAEAPHTVERASLRVVGHDGRSPRWQPGLRRSQGSG